MVWQSGRKTTAEHQKWAVVLRSWFVPKHPLINAKTVARLHFAEAAAEWLHARVRKEFWAYAPAETLSCDELIKEAYRGIRPAPGYPACPDHTVKGPLFKLLDAPARTGMALTDSFAMTPAAAVSGFYFAHPDAHYFAVSKIGRDQLEDWAQRTGMSVAEAERWLAPLL